MPQSARRIENNTQTLNWCFTQWLSS